MASRSIRAPMRGITIQLNRLGIAQDAVLLRCADPHSFYFGQSLQKPFTPFARTITTSASSRASLSGITTSADAPISPFPHITPHAQPLSSQAVLATVHDFPSLEPLRFEQYPANHLNLQTRKDILHRAVIYEGDSHRLGTASTKWRSEIKGSARKIRPQKGSGRARLGDKKSPMLRGGGVAFGPKPRDFSTKLQRKVYDLAWRTALSYRFRKGELVIVDNEMEIPKPSSELLQGILRTHRWGNSAGRSLLVTLGQRPNLTEAFGYSGKHGRTLTWEEVDVKDLLEMGRIVVERKALHNILASHQFDLTQKREVNGLFEDETQIREILPAVEEELVDEEEVFDEDLEEDPEMEQDVEQLEAELVAHLQRREEGPLRIEVEPEHREEFNRRFGRAYKRYAGESVQVSQAEIDAFEFEFGVKVPGKATPGLETPQEKKAETS